MDATPRKPLIPGVPVVLDGHTLVVPSLLVAKLRELTESGRIQGLEIGRGALPTVEQIDLLADVAHAALVRNYPGLTQADLLSIMDMRTMRTVMEAVFAASGAQVVEDLTGGTPPGP